MRCNVPEEWMHISRLSFALQIFAILNIRKFLETFRNIWLQTFNWNVAFAASANIEMLFWKPNFLTKIRSNMQTKWNKTLLMKLINCVADRNNSSAEQFTNENESMATHK